jgi:hypothetical protein
MVLKMYCSKFFYFLVHINIYFEYFLYIKLFYLLSIHKKGGGSGGSSNITNPKNSKDLIGFSFYGGVIKSIRKLPTSQPSTLKGYGHYPVKRNITTNQYEETVAVPSGVSVTLIVK